MPPAQLPPPASVGDTLVDRMEAQERACDGRRFLSLLGVSAQELSYRELLADARAYARRLRATGAGSGAVVIVMLPHGRALYASFVGALLAGLRPAMFASPSVKHSAEQFFDTVGALVAAVDPCAIVADARLADDLGRHLGGLGAGTAMIVPGQEDAGDGAPDDGPAAWAHDPDDVAFIQFSSGTTGLKKAVALTHRQVLDQLDRYSRALALDPERDVICSWLPLYHDMGLVACCLLPLVTGTPLVAMSPFDWVRRPRMLLEAMTEHRATLSWAPNFSLSFLAKSVPPDQLSGLDLSPLRALVNCSEPITERAMRDFDDRFGAVGWSPEAHAASYALAENTFAVTSGGAGKPLARCRRGNRTHVSCGRLLDDTEVRLVDGEIAIRSPSLFTGYHGGLSEAARFEGGLFLTGDLGFVQDGELYVTGRKKDLLILRGENYFPQDIEEVVGELPGVIAGRVAALGRFDEESGTEELLVVAEVAEAEAQRSDGAPDRRRIARSIAHRLAEAEGLIAARIVLAPHRWLLKSTSGKMARGRNLERVQAWERGAAPDEPLWVWSADADAPAVEDRPLDEAEELVCRLLRGELSDGATPLPESDGALLAMDLLMTGALDSLRFAGLLMQIEVSAGMSLPDADLAFTERLATGAGLAAVVRRQRGAAPAPSVERDNDHEAKCRLYAQSSRDHDVLVLGSSRTMNLRTTAASARGLTAFNLSVSGPSMEDLAVLLRYVAETAVRAPRWILTEVHADLFPVNTLINSQILDHPILSRYLPGVLDAKARARLVDISRRARGGEQLDRRRALILKWLQSPEQDPGRSIFFEPGTGDMRYVPAAGDTVAQAINEDRAVALPDDAPLSKPHLARRCEGGTSFDPNRAAALRCFLDHGRGFGSKTRLVFFEPPEHASLGRHWALNVPDYASRRELILSALKGAEHHRFDMFDLRDPTSFGGDPADFRDSWHMGGHNGALLMGWLLDRVVDGGPP